MAHFSIGARSPNRLNFIFRPEMIVVLLSAFPHYCTCAPEHCIFSPPLPLGYVMKTCGVLQLSTFVNFRDEIENENG